MTRFTDLVATFFIHLKRCHSQNMALLVLCLFASQTHIVHADTPRYYNLDIQADFRKAPKLTDDGDCVPIKVKVSQKKHLLKSLSWKSNRYLNHFKADGKLSKVDDEWRWEVPKKGGSLRYCAQLTHTRGERYDSRITKNWALFRADDLFPAAKSIAIRGSESRTSLEFKLPDNWNSIAAYPQVKDHVYEIDNKERSFDRPTGWVQLGNLGIRRDLIANTQVAVAAPIGEEVTRLEIMTFLTFTIPTLRKWFPNFTERLLVVNASDGMWRGALSGPSSLFLHGERPLVSENATSTVIHELVHVALERQATDDADWIDEGLAEYMALVLLHRAGGMTDRRFRAALEEQKKWGETVDALAKDYSSGAATARAVTVFAQLHEEIGDQHFREVIKKLAGPGPAISESSLRKMAESVSGQTVNSLP